MKEWVLGFLCGFRNFVGDWVEGGGLGLMLGLLNFFGLGGG